MSKTRSSKFNCQKCDTNLQLLNFWILVNICDSFVTNATYKSINVSKLFSKRLWLKIIRRKLRLSSKIEGLQYFVSFNYMNCFNVHSKVIIQILLLATLVTFCKWTFIICLFRYDRTIKHIQTVLKLLYFYYSLTNINKKIQPWPWTGSNLIS